MPKLGDFIVWEGVKAVILPLEKVLGDGLVALMVISEGGDATLVDKYRYLSLAYLAEAHLVEEKTDAQAKRVESIRKIFFLDKKTT